MVHCFHDLADTVGFSEDDLDHTRRPPAPSSAFLSVVVRTQVLFLRASVCFRSWRKLQCLSKGRGKSYTIILGLCASRKATRSSVPSWISADRAEAAGKTLAIEGLAEGVEELRAGVEDRHRGRRAQHADRTFLAESEAQAQGASRGSETCRGDSERSEDYRGGLRGAVMKAGGAPHCTPRRAVATFKPAGLRASRLEGSSPTCTDNTVDL